VKKRQTNIPFAGTAEQEAQLLALIDEMKDRRDSLIPIMQKAQDIYGYLPMEVQTIIARELRIPQEDVYGAATYYQGFQLNPRGKYQITVCLGSACQMNGAQAVYNKISELLEIGENECTPDLLFSMETRHCVGACATGPVMMVNDTVYGRMTPEKAEQLIAQCRADAEKGGQQ